MRFVVSGDSMKPAYPAGSKVFVSSLFKPRVGDVVVLRDPRDERLVLKRIKSFERRRYFVEGDNIEKSTDSRHFGEIEKESIMGKVMFKYPKDKEGWLVFSMRALASFGVLDSSYLTYSHYQQGETLCDIIPGSCDLVTGSSYAVVFGVPLAILGAFFYLSVLVILFLYKKMGQLDILKILAGWTAIGFAMSLYLTYLQAFVINAYCLFCLGSALTSTTLFILALVLFKSKKSITNE
ncbi:hypothetical protein KKH05_01205 [Patescibacteria group bacterium]|nr:hypothetical protein [Patescibacteria group bacterium]